MPAEDIITAYAYRFKIEAMFPKMKQHIGGLFYHFWTNAFPRLDRYRKKGADNPSCKGQARAATYNKDTHSYRGLCDAQQHSLRYHPDVAPDVRRENPGI